MFLELRVYGFRLNLCVIGMAEQGRLAPHAVRRTDDNILSSGLKIDGICPGICYSFSKMKGLLLTIVLEKAAQQTASTLPETLVPFKMFR